MAVERTLILAKPDAVERNLAGEILARFERRGLKLRAARLRDGEPRARRDALRRAQREAVLRRARRLHHLRADARVRARGRRRDRDVPQDDRRDEPGRRRSGLAPRRPSRSRCRTTSCTAPTRPSRPSARSGSGSPMARLSCSGDDAAKNARALDAGERGVHGRQRGARTGRTTRSPGASGRSTSPSSTSSVTWTGLDVVELGCGTAYFSAWLAKRGARPVGVDITPAQLETARRMHGARRGSSSRSSRPTPRRPACPTRAFDLVVSEYGASIWVDPYRWIPEAARLLRPGGRLVFLRNSTLVILCSPDDEGPANEHLARPQFGLHRFEWADGGVEFHLAARRVDRPAARERLRDRAADRAPGARRRRDARATTTYVTADWARKWPSEEIWAAKARTSRAMSAPPAPPLLLASTSPQRRAILEQLAIPFDVVAPDYEEAPAPTPLERAAGKARSVDGGERPVLGVDTEVLVRRRAARQARERAEAEAMLEPLAGPDARGRLRALPAHARVGGARTTETTLVTFRALTPRDLAHYVASQRVGGTRRRRTRSRGSARASSSGSRATT